MTWEFQELLGFANIQGTNNSRVGKWDKGPGKSLHRKQGHRQCDSAGKSENRVVHIGIKVGTSKNTVQVQKETHKHWVRKEPPGYEGEKKGKRKS